MQRTNYDMTPTRDETDNGALAQCFPFFDVNASCSQGSQWTRMHIGSQIHHSMIWCEKFFFWNKSNKNENNQAMHIQSMLCSAF